MTLNRYSKRRDTTEPEVIAALETVGAVYRLDRPVDLLFWSAPTGYLLIEVKAPKGRIHRAQSEWARDWPGPVHFVRSGPEALAVVREASAS